MNNAGGLKKNLLVILNDNKMSICPRVGGLADYLDRLRMAIFYTGLKAEVQKVLARAGDRRPVGAVPLAGQGRDQGRPAGRHALRGIGVPLLRPGRRAQLRQLQKYLDMVREFKGPVLLHVVTEKGHGFEPAAEDPVLFHTPAPFSARTARWCR